MEATQTRRRGRPRGRAGADLLDVARGVFVEHGFAGATMDAVAAGGRISKQSLYRDYASKDLLFAAVVRDWVDRGRDAMRPHTEALAATADVRAGLAEIADVMQRGILSPAVVQIRTLVATEAARFPDVAADYVSRSWDRNIALLGDALAMLTARGLLAVAQPRMAAEQFTWLVIGAAQNQLTLAPSVRPDQPALRAAAEQAVQTFLCRYGPTA